MSRVIALSGYKNSGKDTVADMLVREHDYKKISFAEKLKDLVSTTYNVPRNDIDDRVKKEQPLVFLPVIPSDPFTAVVQGLLKSELSSGYWTPRALCILEGSMKRSVNSNYWVSRVINEIKNNSNTKYVISDLRYITEADTLKLMIPDIRLVRVERFEGSNTDDPSERNLDKYRFDVYIPNKDTMATLENNIRNIMQILNLSSHTKSKLTLIK